MAEEPDEYQLAISLAQKIGDSLLGSASTAITDPILGAFGLGGASDYTAYFEQIGQQLQKIQVSIDQLSQKVDAISQEIDALSRATTAIASELSDAELQNVLEQYATDANVVEQNFQTYSATLKMMADPTQVKHAIDDLFQLFQINNLDAVATAMRNLHLRFNGGGETKGIISFQGDVCEKALVAWANHYGRSRRRLRCYGFSLTIGINHDAAGGDARARQLRPGIGQ